MRSPLLLAAAILLGSLASAVPASAQDMEPVFYMSKHKVQWARMDSLATLVTDFEAPWHRYVSENVPGYQRWYFFHDTGDEYNFMIVTMYPDWDMVRGDEMPYEELLPQFLASIGMTMEAFEAEDTGLAASFEWAYEGSQHVDTIWRPVGLESPAE